jgi:hypothetical protein
MLAVADADTLLIKRLNKHYTDQAIYKLYSLDRHIGSSYPVLSYWNSFFPKQNKYGLILILRRSYAELLTRFIFLLKNAFM